MHRYAVCNLLTTLSYPPWTKGLDRVVYITRSGEEQFPFHAYVHPDDTCTDKSHHSATFWSFSRLPEEIQLHVLAICPASILFQLMHTCSKLRTEASKQFWAKADAYFPVEAHWLINKAYPGDSVWNMTFLAQVHSVEVDYSLVLNDRICMRQQDERVEIQSNLVDIFWASLQNRVPNVKRVIPNYNKGNTGREYGLDRIPLALRLLIEASPHGIESSVLFLERKQTSHPTTWRTATWRRCLLRRTEQALDRHHFDMGRNEPFSCPVASCTAYFSKSGQWTIHAAEEHYQEWKRLLESLPSSSVGAGLRERNQALDRKTREVQEQYKEMKDAWKTGDEARRGEIQRSWIEQLDNDAAWETEKKGTSELWNQFMEDVHTEHSST
ncbi:hypothetical protein DM02DRAFT_700709 [Periconia macrospinosa]|uniref:C2H2-type domain-containing protein n=1 Tax=Periconia macrospinosa TaxID=97972 RepID=A0A2V1EDG9_9PLEO|nr:hypothetical protein DM02DRAFT_700709 [Periconia macrospinosa]